jgi:hypothetical protein
MSHARRVRHSATLCMLAALAAKGCLQTHMARLRLHCNAAAAGFHLALFDVLLCPHKFLLSEAIIQAVLQGRTLGQEDLAEQGGSGIATLVLRNELCTSWMLGLNQGRHMRAVTMCLQQKAMMHHTLPHVWQMPVALCKQLHLRMPNRADGSTPCIKLQHCNALSWPQAWRDVQRQTKRPDTTRRLPALQPLTTDATLA